MNSEPSRPRLIVIAGPPCAGKTTLADALHREIGGVSLDVDRLRQAIIPESNQSEADRNVAYASMHVLARELLSAGVSPVMVTATYIRREQRRRLADAIGGEDVDVLVVECAVAPATAAVRFVGRSFGHAAVDLTIESVEAACSAYPFMPDEAVVLDTTESLDRCIEQIRQSLVERRATSLSRWRSVAGR